jgi:uncharacterized membrane protein YfcA
MSTELYILPIAFLAGFVDAIAGGGGLILVPGLLLLFPQIPVVNLLGTNKLASFCGTFAASAHYIRTLNINFKVVFPALISSFLFAALGAKITTLLHNQTLKPIVFGLLILIGVYTLVNKQLGAKKNPAPVALNLRLYCVLVGSSLGFYDGFFGPGTGSFLIFCFVGWLGFSFLEGSAYAKLTNLASNLAAMLYFGLSGHIIYKMAVPMAVFNILGNMLGARLAIKKGSQFVRWVFLSVIVVTLLQFAYQMGWLTHAGL